MGVISNLNMQESKKVPALLKRLESRFQIELDTCAFGKKVFASRVLSIARVYTLLKAIGPPRCD
jgi:hypothetical protein